MMIKNPSLVLFVALVLSLSSAFAETGARTLPFLSSLAGDRELPLPFGASVLGYWQEHSYDLTRLSASSALDPRINQAAQMVDPGSIDVDNEVAQVGLKADAWLLPFLNVSALAGYIEGETDVQFGALPAAGAAPVLRALDNGLDVDYSGFLYGVGAMLTAGVGPVFGALNGIATWAELDDESSVRAYIVRPIIGVRIDKFSLWTGAMYQDAQEKHKGSIEVPGLGPVSYDITLEEKEPWNWLLGAGYSITENWGIAVEGGFGDRTQVETALTYRF